MNLSYKNKKFEKISVSFFFIFSILFYRKFYNVQIIVSINFSKSKKYILLYEHRHTLPIDSIECI